MGFTVVTYGGGEILNNIFNAIAMLMNSKHGGFIQPLMIISISIGTLWAVTKAFFTSSGHAFLANFMIPLIAIVGLFMVPTANVHIEDILKNTSYKVDHVPFLLAKFAELTSSVGYQVTRAVEKTMHVPNDVAYNNTGMIFGADAAMDISRYKITNADLDKNLRTFCQQCVLYDLHLGRYTVDELKKSTDLWKFLEERTSKVRMIKYTPIGSEHSAQKPLSEYLTCKDAVKTMTPYFRSEKKYYAQLDICKNLGLTYQALTGMQKNAEELISQQLMMNLLSDEFSSNSFSKGRAHLQQRNTYQILGSLASNSLVTLRAVIEALVYAAFIFIIPLSVLPGGFKFITTWIGLVVWIQLWPPFYAILNYIMQSVAHGYANTVFHGISDQGLSLFTSVGLHNLQADIYALSGYLAASIPFLTYAILKGGVGSFVHLASSMMTPAHYAATTAATEQTTGNYSYGNTSFGQTSYKNTTGLHTNLAPSLSGGFFHENRGTSSAIYGQEEQILKQSNSELRTSLFSDESISQSLQTSKMHAQSTTDNTLQTYSESIGSHSRNIADLSNHLTNSESLSNGLSQREAYDLQDSARYFQNVAENLGRQYGLSTRESMETLAGLGINAVIRSGASGSFGGNKERALNAADNIIKSEEFQKHFQKLQDTSSSEAYNYLDEKGMRLVESHNQSFDQMQTSQESYQIAQSNLNQISENATWAEQNSHLIRRSLNQDFVNWASDRYVDQGGFAKAQDILTGGDSATQADLMNEFISHIKTYPSEDPRDFVDPYTAAAQPLPHQLTEEKAQNAVQQTLNKSKGQFSTQISERKEALSNQFDLAGETHRDTIDSIATETKTTREKFSRDFKREASRPLLKQSVDRASNFIEKHPALASTIKNLGFGKKWFPKKSEKECANNFQITQEPFWMKKGEPR